MAKLRLMTNNIWACDDNHRAWAAKGEDCSTLHRVKGFTRTYNETLPDVLGLQECTGWMANCLMDALTSNGLPYRMLWSYDTPIIYRRDKFDCVDTDFYLYPDEIDGIEGNWNTSKMKSYNIAVLRCKENGKLLTFANTHLWWMSGDPDSHEYRPHSDEVRNFQIELLMNRLDDLAAKYDCPQFIVGDLNTTCSSETIQMAFGRGYHHAHDIAVEYADETNGHHFCFAAGYDRYENPKTFAESIDHILVKNAPEGFIRRFERFYPDYYMPLSDHFPCWVDVEI